MPLLINGCGTRYVGKQNQSSRSGTCTSCGRFLTLQSFDTRLCFVIIFIPVIPLSKKRIIDQCSSCRRHFVMPLRKWEMKRQLSISGGLDDYRNDPSVEKGIQAHAAMIGFRETPQADAFRTELEQQFPESVPLQLYLAGTYREHGLGDRADAAVQRAYALRPDLVEVRLAMAGLHRRAGRLDEARSLISMLEQPGAGSLYPLSELELLGYAYQDVSQHQEAFDLLHHLLRKLPDAGQNPAFRKRLQQSEKYLNSGQTVVPKMDRSFKALMREKRSRGWLLAGIAAAAILIGMGIQNEYLRRHRQIVLLNGWKTPLTVSVDRAAPETIAPGAKKVILLKEGSHRAQVTGAMTREINFTMASGYFDRFFKSPVWILNPGGLVPLQFIEATYAKSRPAPSSELYIGKDFLTFENVDRLFETLPETVSIKSGQSKTLTSLNIPQASVAGVVQAIGQERGSSNGLTAAESLLPDLNEDQDLLDTYRDLPTKPAEAQRCRDFLKKQLHLRPVQVPWHRTWQDLHPGPEEKAGILSFYQDLLKQEPENASLLYLTGRAMEDGSESMALYLKARQGDPENPWPCFALGYLKMEQGHWQEAREYLQQAEKLAPGDRRFASTLFEIRLGCGEATQLAAELAKAPIGMDLSAQFRQLRALAVSGDTAHGTQIQQRITQFLTTHDTPPDEAKIIRYQWLSMSRQFAELAKLTKNDKSAAGATARYWLAVQDGDLAAALQEVKPAGIALDLMHHLTIWTAAQHAKDSTLAESSLKAVLSGLKESGSEARTARLLSQQSDITQEQLDQLYLEPPLKALLCAGLIGLHPAQKEFLAGQARLFNVDRRFPAQVIERCIQ